MKNNKRKIIIPFIVVGILVFVFWYGGNAPGLRGWTPEQTKSENVIQTQSPAPSAEVKPEAQLMQKILQKMIPVQKVFLHRNNIL